MERLDMALDRVFSRMKHIIYSLMDNNGNWRTVPIGALKGKELSEDRIKFLHGLINLFLNTNYLHEESKMYLRDEDITIKTVHRNLEDDSIPFKTVLNRIMNDQNKVDNAFGNRMLYDVVDYNRPIDRYVDILAELACKSGGVNKYTDMLLFKVPNDVIYREPTINFKSVRYLVTTFNKTKIRTIEESFTEPEIAGYFNYLLSSVDLTPTDRVFRCELLKVFDYALYLEESEKYNVQPWEEFIKDHPEYRDPSLDKDPESFEGPVDLDKLGEDSLKIDIDVDDNIEKTWLY
jgi:hypothetical protein